MKKAIEKTLGQSSRNLVIIGYKRINSHNIHPDPLH